MSFWAEIDVEMLCLRLLSNAVFYVSCVCVCCVCMSTHFYLCCVSPFPKKIPGTAERIETLFYE